MYLTESSSRKISSVYIKKASRHLEREYFGGFGISVITLEP